MARHCEIGDDILDTRDIIARFQEAETEWDSQVTDALEEAKSKSSDPDNFDEDEFKDKYARECMANGDPVLEEFRTWKAFCEECENEVPDFKYGATLILDSHFEDYAREFAEDIGAIKSTDKWPYTCIDWEQAADELKQDFSIIEVEGKTYYYHS